MLSAEETFSSLLGAWRLMKYLSHGAKDEELADIMVGGMR